MALTPDQVAKLMSLVSSTNPDEMDCDGCFEHLAEFAESMLEGRQIPDALTAVRNHLEQCPCCHHEFEALLDGLREMETE